jgi:cytoskeletal protein CcmA (bactofilin family)
VFKKSEEQEWTRFRGALAKDRDDAPQELEPQAANGPQAGPAPAQSAVVTRQGSDVNVGLQSRPRSLSSDNGEVESLIGERTTFEGTFACEGSMRVMGTVQGELQSKGTIFIDEKARVTARVTGAQVTIAGRVDGQIHCDGRVEIRPTGRVTGEIHAGALIMQEGAFFDGNSKMATPGGTSVEAPAPAAAATR